MSFCSLVLAVLALISAQAGAAQAQGYLDVPVNIAAPVRPTPVLGDDGKRYLVYHLFVTNWSFADMTLERVEVTDGARGTVLARYGEKELGEYYRFRALLPTPPRSEVPGGVFPRAIASGRTGVLFFWISLDASTPVPKVLRHRLEFDSNATINGFEVAVNTEAPIKIGPPLRGGDWLCGNGPAYNTNHQYLTIRDGKVRIAQRFAIDFKKVDTGGNVLPSPFPDEITNRMFYGYGAEVLAVADATVAFVKDGIPENTPQASGEIKAAVPITSETVSGNWIGLDLGGGRFAFYAHLQPGSIRVKAGDRVRRGQVIGLLGNSGNSVGPHLHFHIGDAPSLNGCEGLPFVLDSFEIVGQPREHHAEIPLDGSVVQFDVFTSMHRMHRIK